MGLLQFNINKGDSCEFYSVMLHSVDQLYQARVARGIYGLLPNTDAGRINVRDEKTGVQADQLCGGHTKGAINRIVVTSANARGQVNSCQKK